MINSKDKGKRAERSWRDKLREWGFLGAYRSQQYCGSENSADVICPELSEIHFEVKHVEKLNIYDAMQQAQKDCGNKTPVVCHKKNNHDWLVTMCGDDWLDFMRLKEDTFKSVAR